MLLVPQISDETVNADLIKHKGIDCHPPDQDKTQTAITRLESIKSADADGLQAEVFKTGSDKLIRRMYQLIGKISLDMTGDWSFSVLCPIFKKGDPTICAKFRGLRPSQKISDLISVALSHGKDICEPFKTKKGLRQGDTLPRDLFNIILEVIIRKAAVNTKPFAAKVAWCSYMLMM